MKELCDTSVIQVLHFFIFIFVLAHFIKSVQEVGEYADNIAIFEREVQEKCQEISKDSTIMESLKQIWPSVSDSVESIVADGAQSLRSKFAAKSILNTQVSILKPEEIVEAFLKHRKFVLEVIQSYFEQFTHINNYIVYYYYLMLITDVFRTPNTSDVHSIPPNTISTIKSPVRVQEIQQKENDHLYLQR